MNQVKDRERLKTGLLKRTTTITVKGNDRFNKKKQDQQ